MLNIVPDIVLLVVDDLLEIVGLRVVIIDDVCLLDVFLSEPISEQHQLTYTDYNNRTRVEYVKTYLSFI